MSKSVYIHIPFCNQICTYCDFAKVFWNEEKVTGYLINLKKEIYSRYQNEEIKTLYIGGGTPSSLNSIELNNLFSIIEIFNKADEVEFTFECNIEDIDDELLKYLKSKGVNRLSIGVQTFNEKHISFLGRGHTRELAISNLKKVKKYFSNFSVDLIYAIPNQTIAELKDDLNILKSLNVPHISTYSLMIEEHTKLFIDGIKNIDEDLDFKMYNLILEELNRYHHYEISNFSKSKFESKHNLVYWNNEEYYGFGIGAASYINSKRFSNTRSFKNYFEGNYIYEEERLSLKDKMNYEIILGLRKTNGINLEDFKSKYEKNFLKIKKAKEILEEEKLVLKDGNIFINEKFIYVSNEIIASLLDD